MTLGWAVRPAPRPQPLPLECRIVGLAGFLCSVSLTTEATLLELKNAIEVRTGIPSHCQRLCHTDQELRKDEDLARMVSHRAVVDLTLVRRPEEQARWLRDLAAARSPVEWIRTAPERARGDREAVLAAVAQDGFAIRYAAPELRADREVVLAAVAQSGRALEHAAVDLQADREVALVAMAQDGRAFSCVPPELRGDREVMLLAIAQAEWTIELASQELRADREVVLAAVAQNRRALEHATRELREDLEFDFYCCSVLLRAGLLAVFLSPGFFLSGRTFAALCGVYSLLYSCSFFGASTPSGLLCYCISKVLSAHGWPAQAFNSCPRLNRLAPSLLRRRVKSCAQSFCRRNAAPDDLQANLVTQ